MLHFIIPLSEGLYTFLNVMDRNPIREVTKHQTGIYCWINNTNGKCYVGKNKGNLYVRLSNYYQSAYLNSNRHSSLICKAILKYGISAFTLVILEIDPVDLAVAEQYWIDNLNSQYNTQRNVLVPVIHSGNLKPDRSGPKNSFYGRNHTPEAIGVIRLAALARLKPNNPGHPAIITDTLTNTSASYTSIREGITAMGWDQPNTMRFLRNGTRSGLYLKRYTIVVTA